MKWAVILAGGAGSRFWPLSTPSHPKQVLPLAGDNSTAEQAVQRLAGLVPIERVLLVTGDKAAPALGELLHLPAQNLLVEPRPASTAPALVWATHEAWSRDPDAEVVSLHADWVIREESIFRQSATTALRTASTHRRLVTVGIVPTRPETGYGYIVPGAALDREARAVKRFTEKPDAATALDLMADGALWNSGLFAWRADVLLEQIRNHTPEIAPALGALERKDVAGFFAAVQPVSIDVGLLERSPAVAVVPGAFSWDDIGTWDALPRVRPRDPRGNVASGPVYFHEAQDCVAWSDGEPVILAGVRDLVVVKANGRILVMPRSAAADLKKVLDSLPPRVRDLE
ncbi:MAG TPA: sugar phosphate nucleotidyltransferase [Gemmatimonadales bacterium]|nr:sugar phosphate nucleotidyltransferase [Gemmatimonadales bacterium]